MRDRLLDRLIKYTKINTRSNPYSKTIPSSENQFDLANILVESVKVWD